MKELITKIKCIINIIRGRGVIYRMAFKRGKVAIETNNVIIAESYFEA